jgi:hypothetical protein
MKVLSHPPQILQAPMLPMGRIAQNLYNSPPQTSEKTEQQKISISKDIAFTLTGVTFSELYPRTLSFELNGTFCWELVPSDWLNCIQSQSCLSTCGACLQVVFDLSEV